MLSNLIRRNKNTEENAMPLQEDYFDAYRSLKLTRDVNGVLVAEFHSNGGPFFFTTQDHNEFLGAFFRIAQERENKILNLPGAGGEVIPDIYFFSFCHVPYPAVCSQIHHE